MRSAPRFLADEMLGSLARWLRMMGYDTAYARDVTDAEVLRRARAEGRTVLTRDHQLAKRAGEQGLLVESDDLEDQLIQVSTTLGLSFEESYTRCTICNGELRNATLEEGARAPPRVRESQERLYVCQECGQLYWRGSHWSRIVERLERMLELRCGSSPR
ncbi:MAG: hypothetical protein A4E31_01088 [Methanomassiliicoccales archaeon PtaU1.Bin030]|jgi:uncharacterized protein with PIN domain|nr:MAG: hypothetical protein A4E31_01088 [Methanomassiliicoccales archaeon PtaU1.Bin030]